MILRRGLLLLVLVLILAAFPVFWAYTTDILDKERLANAAGVAQIVGLVGVVLAVPQLWYLTREQRRIAEDLARRPDIHVGFTQGRIENGKLVEAPSRVLAVIAMFTDESEFSQPFQVRIVMLNTGMRSARDVTFNLRHDDRITLFHQSRSTFVDENGVRILAASTDYIHPLDYYFIEVRLQVKGGLTSVDLTGTVTMSDDPEQVYPLRLAVSPS